jgi:hypothetical protein
VTDRDADAGGRAATSTDATVSAASATAADRPTVILDTNALMMPVELDIRVFDELDRLVGDADLVVPRAVVAELEKLGEAGNGEEATAASVGRDLAARCRVADYAVTNDRPLRDRLLERGVRVIGLRGRTTLEITEP